MNPISRPVLSYVVLAVVVLGGCADARHERAHDLIEQMAMATQQRDVQQREALGMLLEEHFTLAHQLAVARWNGELWRIEATVRRKVAEKAEAMRSENIGLLERAVTPALDRLQADIAAAQQAGPGQGERVSFLQAQMGSALITFAQEQERLRDLIDDRLKAILAKALDDVAALRDTLPKPLDFNPKDMADKVIAELDKTQSSGAGDYAKTMAGAYKQLLDYLEQPSALRLFSQGLFNETVRTSLERVLGSTGVTLADKLGATFDRQVQTLEHSLVDKVEGALLNLPAETRRTATTAAGSPR